MQITQASDRILVEFQDVKVLKVLSESATISVEHQRGLTIIQARQLADWLKDAANIASRLDLAFRTRNDFHTKRAIESDGRMKIESALVSREQ